MLAHPFFCFRMDPTQSPTPAPSQAPTPAVSMEDLTSTIQSIVAAAVAAAVEDIRTAARAPPPHASGDKRPLNTTGEVDQGPNPKLARSSESRPSTPVPAELSDGESEAASDHEFLSEAASPAGSGESASEDPQGQSVRSDRLFMTEDFDKLLKRVLFSLGLQGQEEEVAPTPSTSFFDTGSVFPKQRPSPQGFPVHPAFLGVLQKEWEAVARARDPRPPAARLYTIVGEQMPWLSAPKVDAPIAALGAPSTLASDSEALPKDPSDKRIEVGARWAFEAASWSLRASMAASMVNRTSLLWCQRLAEQEGCPAAVVTELRRIARDLAFSADATQDAMQMAARAMTSSVAVRRSVWLRKWNAENAAQAKLIELPFKGGKLFGEDLDLYLVDTKGKGKALPSRPKARSSPSSRGGTRSSHSYRPNLPFRSAPSSDKSRPFWASRKQRDYSRPAGKPASSKRGGKR